MGLHAATGASRDRRRLMGPDLELDPGLDPDLPMVRRLPARSGGAGRRSLVLLQAGRAVVDPAVDFTAEADSMVAADTATGAAKGSEERCAFYWSKTTRISSGS